MRNVYLVECESPSYVCVVCSSYKTAVLAKYWYYEVVGKGQKNYQIRPLPLMDSSFNSFFRKIKR